MLEIIKYPKRESWSELLTRPSFDTVELEEKVKAILSDVKKNGDEALFKYSLQFDKVQPSNFLVSPEEIHLATQTVAEELKSAIQLAKENIFKFHSAQREEKKIVETRPGVECWRKSIAIEKVGLYIPGGTAPLFSTVLMLAVPAAIAGCKEIILCTPPAADGKINPAILYSAQLCGVTKIIKLGGVQAIGAMAYGTQTVPRVFKIFGPGNQFVTAAKQLVSKDGVAIDMPAGPSEVAVFADQTCVPEFVAADLLSQAEHGTDSQVVLVSTDAVVVEAVLKELKIQLELLPRKDTALLALANSKAIIVENAQTAADLLNEYAAEHLILACADAGEFSEKIVNAGSVFIGNYSCESAGDYASGTNHTLPTNGYARAYSGVSLDSFIRKITFQKISAQGLKNIGPAIEVMAEAEGLRAHRNAVSIRLKK